MEREKSQPNMTHRLLTAVLPVVFIAITYVDPGKWVATIEGGARFGCDLVVLMFVFSLAAVLCQYLSASIAVVTGRDLAQICSTEYDAVTCVLLGIQAELSMIALDLTMILGTAHALNLTFGIGLFTCVVLTSLDAFLCPVFSSYMENGKAKLICMWLASVALFSYFFGVVTSQRDTSLSMGGLLNLSGESAFALMGLLGASIMPHNFYLHSSIVQQHQGPTHVSKGALCNDHLFAIFCAFSGFFVINCILMNSAANVFYSTGLDLSTFQDALSLMDQVFRSLMAPFALVIVLVLSYHTTALTWKFSGQSVLLNFFKIDIPGWSHHSTIRFISLIPALTYTWHSGAEGAYQLMLCTQITVAVLLLSSVVPLFRVASSRSIMGVNKISQYVEYIVWVTYVGILGLVIVFVVEMMFGTSDWASNLRWTMWGPYVFILTTASLSILLMLWLVVTPLKSASFVPSFQQWDDNSIQDIVPESSFIEEKQESPREIQEMVTHESGIDSARDFNLPDDILDYDSGPRLTTIEENSSHTTPSLQQPDDSPAIVESVPSPVLKTEIDDSVEKTVRIDGNPHLVKEPEWEPEDPPKTVSVSGTATETNQSPTSNGPSSFRSLGAKKDDILSGPASLSKLGGLGRAARRQLATTLDDFWKLLFDLHGEMTQDARLNKLDKLLGIDSKVNLKASPVVTNMTSLEIDPVYGVQRGPTSLLTSYQQLLDAYTANQGLNVMDPEKRYHSLRLPHTSGPYTDQPATVHGYQIKSYINQTMQNSDYFQSQIEPLSPNSPPLVSSNYKSPVSVTKTVQNGLRPAKPPGFPDPVVSRNSSMQPERAYRNIQPVAPVENVHEKKYYSMPDISGLLPNRESKIIPERDAGLRYGTLGQSVYSSPLYRSGTITGYGGLSYSNLSRDAAAYHPASSHGSRLGSRSGSDTWSMWSKQPSEQFGVAEKVNPRPNLSSQEPTAHTVDSEGNLLKSFRLCVVKLLKLEGSEWLFKQNGGLDEHLVDRVAARERFLYEIEVNRVARGGGTKVDENEYNKYLVTSVPNCGEDCVWRIEVIKSFGVWCMHRILELSLMESRPELWGKYTYVLNRLQGIIEPAFSKPRVPASPCFCLQVPDSCQQRSSPPKSLTSLPPPAKPSRGKCTTAASLLDIVKNVETAISCRKGRPGAAAGDVAFPKGKENLASVLKRYKRRLLAVAPDGLSRSP
ncbi:ethylene-insensitive protein 2.1-like [Bidens hawaiensis]|uniref:ethylene-insensitive protein 2.1-like n=1 Tax=Bidens hawaiensis TaxID=980011 RepID=UPI00404B9201